VEVYNAFGKIPSGDQSRQFSAKGQHIADERLPEMTMK
jgi:hypothetical protein